MKSSDKKTSAVGTFFSRRQHPIRILGYTTRNFWLIFIPLSRDLVASRYNIAGWLRGSWLSILTITVIFGYAFIRWITITYRIEEDCIVARSGYFGLLESKIYYCKVTAVTSKQGPFYRLFRASKIYLNTNSGFSKSTDIVLTIKNSDAIKLFRILNADNKDKSKFSYRPKRSQLLIFSLIFSSSLSGIVILSTFLIQGSKLIDEKMREQLRNGLFSFTQRVEKIATNIPPIALAVAMVFMGSWLLSFVANLLRHWNFTSIRHGSKLIVKSGIMTKRSHILNREKIIFTDSQQNLLMKICRICSVRIHCNGYGKNNREMNALVPISTNREVECSMKLLMPEATTPKVTLRPRLRNIMFYVWPPLIIAAIVPVARYVGLYFFPQWEEVIKFAAVIFEIPALWLALVKLISGFTTGIGVSEGCVSLHFCRMYKFHTVTIPIEQISKISLYQTWPQFLKVNCSIRINTASLVAKPQVIKNFYMDDVVELLKECGCNL